MFVAGLPTAVGQRKVYWPTWTYVGPHTQLQVHWTKGHRVSLSGKYAPQASLNNCGLALRLVIWALVSEDREHMCAQGDRRRSQYRGTRRSDASVSTLGLPHSLPSFARPARCTSGVCSTASVDVMTAPWPDLPCKSKYNHVSGRQDDRLVRTRVRLSLRRRMGPSSR